MAVIFESLLPADFSDDINCCFFCQTMPLNAAYQSSLHKKNTAWYLGGVFLSFAFPQTLRLSLDVADDTEAQVISEIRSKIYVRIIAIPITKVIVNINISYIATENISMSIIV